MPALPAVSDFTGVDRTNAQMKVTHAALHAYLVGLFGSDGVPATALAALGALGAPGVTARTAATTLVPADRGRLINATSGSWALTLPTAATAGAGWAVLVLNSGTGTITLTRAGSDLIDGAATVALAGGMAVLVLSTGSAWVTLTLGGAGSAGRPLRATDVTTSATDATANRLLKVGDFGLGLTGQAPLLANMDAIDTPAGAYRTTSATTGVFPSGANVNGHLTLHRFNATTIWQTYTPGGNAGATAGRLWHRVYNPTTSTWLPWRRVYDQGSILGTVSQSGGVPTEALIETGSNANGRYSRWADGTQMCWHTISAGSGIAAGAGTAASPYATSAFGWTFPAAFALPPVVNGTAAFDGATLANRIFALTVRAVSATAATDMNAVRLSSSTADVSVTAHVTAIGRWF